MLEKNRLFLETENAIKWIKSYVDKTGAKGVVVGNSGGKDSATVIAMAVKALGKEKVTAIAMPCNSIETDFDDAKLVADCFDVELLKIDLTQTYNLYENTLEKDSSLNLSSEAKVNIKPRIRMMTLYAIAQSKNYLVIGTGNLCEKMVGYTTKWGDSASDFNPIANFTVDEVLAIGKYLGVPDKILNKAPADGLGIKTDEEKMGIKYSQIAEMIEKGNIDDEKAKNEIIKRCKASSHKRNGVPIYYFERENFLSVFDDTNIMKK